MTSQSRNYQGIFKTSNHCYIFAILNCCWSLKRQMSYKRNVFVCRWQNATGFLIPVINHNLEYSWVMICWESLTVMFDSLDLSWKVGPELAKCTTASRYCKSVDWYQLSTRFYFWTHSCLMFPWSRMLRDWAKFSLCHSEARPGSPLWCGGNYPWVRGV